MRTDEDNHLVTTLTGKRKREVGPLVPTKYKILTANTTIARVLNRGLLKKKERLKHLEMKYDDVSCFRRDEL